MHAVTRFGILGLAFTVVGVGAAALLDRTPPAPVAPPAAAAPPVAPAAQPPVNPALTQRRGEWSPVCASTQQPLVDFSPVDRGNGRHRILVTVHNCSAQPATLAEPPVVWFGGREMMAEFMRPDPERTQLSPVTLPAWESASMVVTWESFGAGVPVDGVVPGGTLSIRMPGIGEGEVRDPALEGLGPTTHAWLSGWTR